MAHTPPEHDLILRTYSPQDFDHLTALWESTGISRPERRDTPLAIDKTLQYGGFLLLLEDPKARMLVGSVWVTQDGRRTYLHHLAILPERQQRGLGRWLLREALERIEVMGLDVKIEVSRNHPALSLYTGAGFVSLGNYETLILRWPLPQTPKKA